MKVWVTSITYRVRYIVRVSIITIFIDRSLSPNLTFSFVPSSSLPHLDELGFQMVKHSGFCNADELTNVHKLFIEKHCVLKMERKYLTFIFHFFDFKRVRVYWSSFIETSNSET